MTDNQAPQGFDASFFPALAKAEEHHFWFLARSELITDVVRHLSSDLGRRPTVLEVGCGTGAILRTLERACSPGTLVGLDFHAEGLDYARRQSDVTLVRGDAGSLPFRTKFDLVCLLDVLEHRVDDTATLAETHRVLRPDGVLLATVPASPNLWSTFDQVAGHSRRYRRSDLEAKLRSVGFNIQRCTYFMMSLYGPAWLSRRLGSLVRCASSRQQVLSELRYRPVPNATLLWLLRRENARLSRGRSLPFGTSLLAVATR